MRGFTASSMKARRRHKKTRESRRDMLEPQNKHSVRDFLKFSHFVATKSTFSYEFSHEPHNLVYHPRTDISCPASVNFHHMSLNATPATEFARCLHLTQPWQCDTQKTHTTTRLNCCACHAKWWWRSPKLRLPQKMEVIFWKRRKSIVPVTQKNFWHVMKHVLESHKVPRLPYETKLRKVWSLQSTSGCDRLRTQK